MVVGNIETAKALSNDKYYLDIAKAVSTKSSCVKCKSACVAVKDDIIVGSSVSECLNRKQKCKSPVTCCYCYHSVVNLSSRMRSFEGCYLYVYYEGANSDITYSTRIDNIPRKLSKSLHCESYVDNFNSSKKEKATAAHSIDKVNQKIKKKEDSESSHELVRLTASLVDDSETKKLLKQLKKLPTGCTGVNSNGIRTYGFAKCKLCGDEFEKLNPLQKYCNKKKVKVCPICHKPFSYTCDSYNKGNAPVTCGSKDCVKQIRRNHMLQVCNKKSN